MKFFNIDCHISVIADIKNIFEELGHTVDHKSLSGHKWVFGFESFNSPVLKESNWKNIDQKMADHFYETHKKELDRYDAFICIYPLSFVKLFERFNKPIIAIAATRYDNPYTNEPTKLNWLNSSIEENNNIKLFSNNQFDKKYCNLFLKKECTWIPSLCDYTKAKYARRIKKSIIFSKINFGVLPDNFIHQNQLGKYTWEDLYSHERIIHFPYNASTMSIFEQYQAGVPLFFPSLELSLSLIEKGVPLFSEICFPSSNGNRQPENFLNKEWLSLSDFYNGTVECNYFDDINDIFNHNKSQPNNNMETNKDLVFSKWRSVLSEIT